MKLAFRRPFQALAILTMAVLVALWLFFHIAPWGYVLSPWNYVARPHVSHEFFAHGTRYAQTGSAFSMDACDRKYDQAWAVMRDDGAEAARKDVVEIAYFVQVGNDSISLLPRLFAKIHHPRNFYVIHVDAKLDLQLRDDVASLIRNNQHYSKNMHMLESEMVTYKAVSMVTNTIAAMTVALEKHPTWDYFINLSGADYPLLSPENQARLLARPRVPLGRLNFVTFFPRNEWKAYSFRIREMHWDPAAVGYQSNESVPGQIPERKTNPLEEYRGFEYAKAEAWMILSRPFVRFVLRSAFAKRMLINHMHSLSVPEHYFIDILYNHPVWKSTIVPDAFRQVVWYLKIAGLVSIPVGQHPYVLDKGKTIFSLWEYISEAKGFFARKFSMPDSELMARIDSEVSGIGLNSTDPNFEAFRLDREDFFKNIVTHFDQLTKKTLALQGYAYPKTAYPRI